MATMRPPEPARTHSVHQSSLKYEDAWVADPAAGVYAVMDGHSGAAAAQLAAHLVAAVTRRLPSEGAYDTSDVAACAEMSRRALTGAFLELNELLQSSGRGAAQVLAAGMEPPAGVGAGWQRRSSGCTATVALRTGRLLTVANVGNSRCVLDTGKAVLDLATDHTLGCCDSESDRLAAAGAQVARLRFDLSGPCGPDQTGCGPLRIWPGGLRMSRSLGDSDASPFVLPYPHMKQVLLPGRATRLILATDGVWDSFETHFKAAASVRGVSIANAASALVACAARKRVYDDRTAVVVDLAAAESAACFKSQLRLDRLSRMSAASDGGSSVGGGIGQLLRRSLTGTVARRGSAAGAALTPSVSSAAAAAALAGPALGRPSSSRSTSSSSLGSDGGGSGGDGAVALLRSPSGASLAASQAAAAAAAREEPAVDTMTSPTVTIPRGGGGSLAAAARRLSQNDQPQPTQRTQPPAHGSASTSGGAAWRRGGLMALLCMGAPAADRAASPVPVPLRRSGSGNSVAQAPPAWQQRRSTEEQAALATSSTGRLYRRSDCSGSAAGTDHSDHVVAFADVDAWQAFARCSYAPPSALLPLIDTGVSVSRRSAQLRQLQRGSGQRPLPGQHRRSTSPPAMKVVRSMSDLTSLSEDGHIAGAARGSSPGGAAAGISHRAVQSLS